MRVTVHGSTGAQGGPVAETLRLGGHDVVGVTRQATSGDPTTVAADLEDRVSLEAAYAGSDAVFVHLPIPADAETPGRWVAALLGALGASTVKQVVFSTSGASLHDAGPDPMLQGQLAGKRALYDGLCGAVDSVVALAPRLFVENLLLPFVAGPLLNDGVLAYPLAADKPISWISHRDVAKAAALAVSGEAAPGIYDLGYPAVTGIERWARESLSGPA